MKKIVTIISSPRKGETYKALQEFERQLQILEAMEIDTIWLREKQVRLCRGCFRCLEKGEEYCPLQNDDVTDLYRRMLAADGLIFATPNYALQVTALLKMFLDRLAFVFHRPCFFHKAYIPIVTQGVYGGKDIVKYLEDIGRFWGFNVARGVCLTTPPGDRTASEQARIDRTLANAARKFYAALVGPQSPVPSLKSLAIFRLARSNHKFLAEETSRDYQYFKEHGWLDSDYYYDIKLDPFKKLVGKGIDTIAVYLARKRKRELELSR
jgi:multimeric flavodoxin WrbA